MKIVKITTGFLESYSMPLTNKQLAELKKKMCKEHDDCDD
jgi:hypothetical protein